MPSQTANGVPSGLLGHVRFIPLSYESADADSARKLVLALRPDWASADARLDFVRFTDGITNTLLKAVNRGSTTGTAGVRSDEDGDADAILLRAYGNGTDLIIDRHRETQNHELLEKFGLAPELLARFRNGMMYRYIRGRPTAPADLRTPPIYRAVARRLAQWHATVPCIHERQPQPLKNGVNGTVATASNSILHVAIDDVAPGKLPPNVWTVMQKWILALSTKTEAQRTRQASLQKELTWLIAELSQRPGLGVNGVSIGSSSDSVRLYLRTNGLGGVSEYTYLSKKKNEKKTDQSLTNSWQLVFAHCDLLCGNVIVEPRRERTGEEANGHDSSRSGQKQEDEDDNVCVNFIDYEYATPSPAAVDIANHFAEWGGFDCDYSALPTRAQRAEFIREYVRTYFRLLPRGGRGIQHGEGDGDENRKQNENENRAGGADAEAESEAVDEEEEARKLMREVDVFRGVPGFYWGIWALIQATISQIDFDYASYAEVRLGEYWAWKREAEGRRGDAEMPLRERRWAQEK